LVAVFAIENVMNKIGPSLLLAEGRNLFLGISVAGLNVEALNQVALLFRISSTAVMLNETLSSSFSCATQCQGLKKKAT
jgi:hypothetical protein